MHRRAITLLILLMITQIVVGQEFDEARATRDTARLRLCYEIADTSNNVDTVAKYASEGIMLFSNGDSIMLADLYKYYGWAQNYSEKYDAAITLYQKAIAIYEKMSEYRPMCICYINMSQCYNGLNDNRNAWKCLYNSLKMAQKSGDTSTISNCYNEITCMYLENNMFVQAIETAHKSLRLSRQTGNYGEMGNSASLLSLAYSDDDSSSIKAAIEWGQRAEGYIGMLDTLDTYYGARLSETYGSLIELYISYYELTGSKKYVDSAAHYYDKLIKLADIIEIPDHDFVITTKKILIKYATQDYKGALLELDAAQKQSKEKGYTYYNKTIYKFYYKTYQKLGDYHNALKYQTLYKEVVMKKINAQATAEAAAFDARTSVEQEHEQIDYEKKMADAEIESNRRHYKNTATAVGIGIAAISIIILVSILMLRNARKTNENLSRHREEIKAQNEMILNEKEVLADKHKKILQSMTYARRIQMATMSSDQELKAVFPSALTCYRPREIVSGDWYWATSLGRKKILAIGGSARHGVPGALVAMMTLNALRDTIGQLSPMSSVSPTAILRTVKSKLPQIALSNNAGVSLCIFLRSGIRFAGINQNAMLIRNGQPIVMLGNQPDDTHYATENGDFVLAYSASTKRELLTITDDPETYCANLSRLSYLELKQAFDNVFESHRQSEDISAVAIQIFQS